MKCKFHETGFRDGKKTVRCERCCQQELLVPIERLLDRIHRRCIVPGLGDWSAYWLDVLGVSKERYSWLLRWLKMLQPEESCTCPARQQSLNEVGWWGERAWRWLIRIVPISWREKWRAFASDVHPSLWALAIFMLLFFAWQIVAFFFPDFLPHIEL